MTSDLGSALYQVTQTFLTSIAPIPPDTSHSDITTRSGIWMLKELTFHHGSYVVDIAVRTWLQPPVDVTLGTNFGIVEWGKDLSA